MAFPSVQEFSELLRKTPADKLAPIVTDIVFPGVPYVFVGDPPAYDRLKTHLSERLGMRTDDVVVIGSGKSGYGLAPDSFPNPYSPTHSDVDVLMVNAELFDTIWYSLLDWHYYVHSLDMNGDEKKWVAAMQKNLWWGALTLDNLKADGQGLRSMFLLRPMRDTRSRWFDAFRSLSQVQGLEKLDIDGWLYRTWDHAILYQADSLRYLKESLRRQA